MKLFKCLVILLAIAMATSCKKPDAKGKKLLNVPLSGEISTLDPANSYDTISASIVYQVYEQLYEYHYLKKWLITENSIRFIKKVIQSCLGL